MSKASEMEATLSAEDLRRLFRYEPESGKLYRRISTSNSVKVGDEAGCVNSRGYRQVEVNSVALKAHRIVWAMQTGAWPKQHIDHIDGNPSNNRFENLRDVTHVENLRNAKRRSDNTSGTVGVVWNKQARKWQSQIRFNGRRYSLGLYDEIENAKAARRGGEDRFGFSENHGRP